MKSWTAREAWRNVISGTSRSGLIALILTVTVVGAQVVDSMTTTAITRRADAFRAAGANVLVLTATGSIDGASCASLGEQPNVIAAGAVRRAEDQYVATLPGESIPTFEITSGFSGVLTSSEASLPAGLVISRDLESVLGAEVGTVIDLREGRATVAGDYAYPRDGRTPGLGYAVLVPTSDRAPFDACWVREWPMTQSTEALLRGVLLVDRPADAPPPQMGQLNSTLGSTMDAAGEFADRWSRWAPVVALIVAFSATAGGIRLRRLELAMARHLGVSRSAQAAILLQECAGWAIPVVFVGMVAGAASGAVAGPDSLWPAIGISQAAPIAAVVGGVCGVMTAALSIRERDVIRYFAER